MLMANAGLDDDDVGDLDQAVENANKELAVVRLLFRLTLAGL
jgi:hypothetical protein